MNVNNDIVDVVEGKDGVWGEVEDCSLNEIDRPFEQLQGVHGFRPGEIVVVGTGTGVGRSLIDRHLDNLGDIPVRPIVIGPDYDRLGLARPQDILNDDVRFMYPELIEPTWAYPAGLTGRTGTSRKSDAHAKAKRKAQKKARAKNRK